LIKRTALLALALTVALGSARSAAAQVPAGPPVRVSWTSDAAAVREGDIITILIDELTLASADRNEANARERDRDIGLRGGSGGTSFNPSLRTQNDVSNRTTGESSRRERFAAEMSAQIMEILPSGIARIEGSKKVQIDSHEQEVTVRGLVRTQDITVANTVESWRIANAELLYDSNDELGKAGGIWSKLLNLILP